MQIEIDYNNLLADILLDKMPEWDEKKAVNQIVDNYKYIINELIEGREVVKED